MLSTARFNMEIKLAELIEDFDLYPRTQIDSLQVAKLTEAILAGETLPPIIVDESYRIIDGFHRRRAFLRALGPEAKVEVEVRTYASDPERYLDALRLNCRHGKAITGAELTSAILKAERFELNSDMVASAVGIRAEKIKAIRQNKVAKVRGITSYGKTMPLKKSVQHLAGKTLTKSQVEAMSMLPGQPQLLLIRQLVVLIETNSINLDDPRIVEELLRLRHFLAGLPI